MGTRWSFDGLVQRSQEVAQEQAIPSPQMPPGVHLGVGCAAVVAVAILTAIFTEPATVQRLLIMAFAVGLGTALIPDWRYAVAYSVIAYLLYLGFLVNQFGELSWSGRSSLGDLAVFVLAFWLGLGQRWMRRGATAHG